MKENFMSDESNKENSPESEFYQSFEESGEESDHQI
jgi:hypothetical protein